MICFVNVDEQRVVCNSGGHLQKSVYPLSSGFEQLVHKLYVCARFST